MSLLERETAKTQILKAILIHHRPYNVQCSCIYMYMYMYICMFVRVFLYLLAAHNRLAGAAHSRDSLQWVDQWVELHSSAGEAAGVDILPQLADSLQLAGNLLPMVGALNRIKKHDRIIFATIIIIGIVAI